MTEKKLKDMNKCLHEIVHDGGRMSYEEISLDLVTCAACAGTFVLHPSGHPAKMSRDNYTPFSYGPNNHGKIVPYYKRK